MNRFYVLFLIALLAMPSGALAQASVDGILDDEKKDKQKDPEEMVETGLEGLLDIVVVTATKREQPISAAPAIISVINARQIKERGYKSVAEALASLPGLYSIKDHVNVNLGVRGINGGMRAGSRIVKVMIDGQPISFRPSTENWLGPELIPIQAVRRIELIRGPTSALYGANAFLGVVNIITQSGAVIDGARIHSTMGLINGNPGGGGSLVMGKKSGSLEILFAGSCIYADRSGLRIRDVPEESIYSSSAQNESRNDTAIPTSAFAKLFYLSRVLGTLSLDFSYQRQDAHGEFLDWAVLPQGKQVGVLYPHIKNRISLYNLYTRGRISRTFFDNFNAALSATISTMGTTDDDRLALNTAGIADFVTRDVGTTGLDLVGEFSYSAKEINTFTLGVDFTADWHRVNTYYEHKLEPEYSITPPENTAVYTKLFSNLGIYLQTIIYPTVLFGSKALNTLGFTAGIRYDRHNFYGDKVNYRIGGVFLWNKISTKILFGTSFKAPASVQLFTNKLRSSTVVVANPDLEPESAKTIEVLVGGEVFSRFNVNLSGFYSVVDNKVEIVPDRTGFNVTPQNVGEHIHSAGFEGDLFYRFKELSTYLNFSFQRSFSNILNAAGEQVDRQTSLYPSFMVKLGATYNVPLLYLGGTIEGQLISARYSSEPNAKANNSVTEEPYPLDAYLNLDLTLSSYNLKLIKNLETYIQFKISNLLGQDYLYPGFDDYDIPNLGRTFFLSITQSI